MEELVGQTIGRYQIIEQLGEGGMATVYRAYDTRLDCSVAFKVVRPEIEQSESFLKRFKREAQALAQLRHPNIVHIIDFGEHEGLPYLVMDYLAGGTLADKMGQPMLVEKAARLLAPVARALEYAHKKGVVHRDVKPSNILLTESEQPMLADFGIAKMVESQHTMTELTSTGVGIGTPDYMAPEQWMGKAETRTDIYALGIVFYELVTGRLPYTAETPAAVFIKHVNDPLPNPGVYVQGLPGDVEGIIIKALEKKPEDRFPHMGAFADALERIIQGLHVDVGVGQPSLRRLPVWLVVLVGGIAVLLVTFVVLGSIAGGRLVQSLRASGNSSRDATKTAPDRESAHTSERPSTTSSPFPTPTISLVAMGEVLFHDDFSRQDSGWETGFYDNGSADYNGGVYEVVSSYQGATMWGAAFKDFTDVVIDVDATTTAGPASDNNDYGVVCRLQENGDGYYLLISSDGYYAIYRGEGDGFVPLVDWSHSSVVRQGNNTNHIQVVCDESNLTLIVNGDVMAETKDTTFTSGDIGLTATTYESASTKVHFDNLVVTEIVKSVQTIEECLDEIDIPIEPNWPVVVCDTFKSSRNWWTGSYDDDSASGSLSVSKEKFTWVITSKQRNFTHRWAVVEETQAFSDVLVSVEGKALENSENTSYGIVFNSNNTGSKQCLFRIEEYNQYYLVECYEYGGWTSLVDWTQSDAILPGEYNRLTLKTEGSDLSLYINEEFIDKIDRVSYSDGLVGLAAGNYEPGETVSVEFDNFVLLAPE